MSGPLPKVSQLDVSNQEFDGGSISLLEDEIETLCLYGGPGVIRNADIATRVRFAPGSHDITFDHCIFSAKEYAQNELQVSWVPVSAWKYGIEPQPRNMTFLRCIFSGSREIYKDRHNRGDDDYHCVAFNWIGGLFDRCTFCEANGNGIQAGASLRVSDLVVRRSVAHDLTAGFWGKNVTGMTIEDCLVCNVSAVRGSTPGVGIGCQEDTRRLAVIGGTIMDCDQGIIVGDQKGSGFVFDSIRFLRIFCPEDQLAKLEDDDGAPGVAIAIRSGDDVTVSSCDFSDCDGGLYDTSIYRTAGREVKISRNRYSRRNGKPPRPGYCRSLMGIGTIYTIIADRKRARERMVEQ